MLSQKTISKTNFSASAIGFGCMGISEFYGETNLSEAKNTIEKAIELGVNHFDTADVYGFGHNEEFLNQVLKPYLNKITIASKFGIVRDKNDPAKRGLDNSKKYIKQACENSLKRLGVEAIDLYYLHRYDNVTTVEEIIDTLSELVKEGKIKYIGLSEVDSNFIEAANKIHQITAVQMEYSLWTNFPEQEIIPLCKKLGIGFVAYSPLGRGFLTGQLSNIDKLDSNDYRLTLPRFQNENLQHNLKLVTEIEKIAKNKQCTPAQVALSYVIGREDNIIAIPGMRRLKYLEDNVKSTKFMLSEAEVMAIKDLVTAIGVAGTRYAQSSMDSYKFKQ
ncbi:aldo/keto reductase [Rickettsiales bacterium LUAb2]